MPLPGGRHLGRLVDYQNGRPVYAVDCCDTDEGLGSGRRYGRLVDYQNGRPVFGSGCCDEPRHLARLIDYERGRPVYAFADPCCVAGGSGSGSSSSSSAPTPWPAQPSCTTAAFPTTLTVTVAAEESTTDGDCTCNIGRTATMVADVCFGTICDYVTSPFGAIYPLCRCLPFPPVPPWPPCSTGAFGQIAVTRLNCLSSTQIQITTSLGTIDITIAAAAGSSLDPFDIDTGWLPNSYICQLPVPGPLRSARAKFYITI